MKPMLILTICMLFAGAVPAQEEQFAKAQAAYDEGRYAEATILYESLIDQGVVNVEVYYNLANAAFKDSDLPTAVKNYRKAWYLAPRDPDIEANLRFALNAAGAIQPDPSLTETSFASLTKGEWIAVGIAGYVLLVLLLALVVLFKNARRTLAKTCLVPIGCMLLAAGGWRYWSLLAENPEWVVVRNDATALFGPVEGSTAHYKLPLAALVRQTEGDSKGWIEVEYDGKRGWLKYSSLKPVSP